MTIEQIIDKHYDDLFDEILKVLKDEGEDIYDLVIECKTMTYGKTIKRSWLDREKRLET